MDLILWRHAEAEDGLVDETQTQLDLTRPLTQRGEKQALRMAAWLDRQLPEGARIWVSPARRCEQTALALGTEYVWEGGYSYWAIGQTWPEYIRMAS